MQMQVSDNLKETIPSTYATIASTVNIVHMMIRPDTRRGEMSQVERSRNGLGWWWCHHPSGGINLLGD